MASLGYISALLHAERMQALRVWCYKTADHLLQIDVYSSDHYNLVMGSKDEELATAKTGTSR